MIMPTMWKTGIRILLDICYKGRDYRSRPLYLRKDLFREKVLDLLDHFYYSCSCCSGRCRAGQADVEGSCPDGCGKESRRARRTLYNGPIRSRHKPQPGDLRPAVQCPGQLQQL